MLFIVKREDIIGDLQLLVNMIEKRIIIPILGDVLVETKVNSIVLTGTDLEIQLRTKVNADIQMEGEITISGKKFFDICRNFPENSEIRVELKGEEVYIQCRRARYKLRTRKAVDFPMFSADEYFLDLSMDKRKLVQLLKCTYFCMASNDIRYYLNGIMVEINGFFLGATASNGHRLAMYESDLGKDSGFEGKIIIPRKGVMELLRILEAGGAESVGTKVSNSNIEIMIGEKIFNSKLIEGKFPDFKAVLSEKFSYHFIFETVELKRCLTRISVLSTERFKKISLLFSKNLLVIRGNNNEQEEAYEEIDIDYSGEDYEANLNISYLIEAITNIEKEKVEIGFTEESDICVIRPANEAGLVYIIMPLQ
ncbi:MAG: DNA polymerase III subunit beta [Methylococcales bacterium]